MPQENSSPLLERINVGSEVKLAFVLEERGTSFLSGAALEASGP